MRQSSGPLMRALALFCGGLLAFSAQARMQSMDDDELSSISGQGAMLTVDAVRRDPTLCETGAFTGWVVRNKDVTL